MVSQVSGDMLQFDSRPCIEKFGCCAGMRVFILVQGSNLIRPDLNLEYRLSPGSVDASGQASLVPPDELEEWAVSYLVEPKVLSLI